MDQTTAKFVSKCTSQTKISLLEAALHRNINPSPVKKPPPNQISDDVMKSLIRWLSQRTVGVLETDSMDKTSYSVRHTILKFLWDMSYLTKKRVPKQKQIMIFAEPDAG